MSQQSWNTPCQQVQNVIHQNLRQALKKVAQGQAKEADKADKL